MGLRSELFAAEPAPETTRIRLIANNLCMGALMHVAQDFLSSEGFTDVQYISPKGSGQDEKLLASGGADIDTGFALRHIIRVEAGDPIVFLAGLHPGCFELFGKDRVHSIGDLKGKKVAMSQLGSSRQLFVAIMAKHVGLDPQKDINWVTHSAAESMRLLAEGKIDAFMAYPPEPQELRAKKIGHVVVNMMMDRPWSQYFCCMVFGNRDFVRRNPVATKRALRAILKATNVVAREPERAARVAVERGITKNYDYALEALKDISYNKWREYDPEDTVRFYSLRLQEVGMIKSSPQKIIAQGTDWRFLRELKKELKA